MLLAAFNKDALPALVLLAAKGIDSVGGGTEEATALSQRLQSASSQGTGKIHAVLSNLYTKESFLYNYANKFLHELDDHGPTKETEQVAPHLWPFISLLQMALIRDTHKVTGCTLWRGGFYQDEKVAGWKRALEAGQRPTFDLRGFTSTSKKEEQADEFSTKDGKNTLLRIDVAPKDVDEAMPGKLYIGCGVDVAGFSAYQKEAEVLLLDATPLIITAVERRETPRKQWRVTAELDFDALRDYFRIFDNEA
jgi:hypothetical protein